MPQEPQIIDLDPDKAPRTTAFILLACGLLGIVFLVINMVFTGQDPYYIKGEWDEGTEPVNQRFDIMPNLVRGRQVGDDSEEDQEAQDVPTFKKQGKPTTSPLTPYQQLLNRYTVPQVPGSPATPPTPGAPQTPAPGIGTPGPRGAATGAPPAK